MIFVGVIDNIVPREAIENALSPDLRELIFVACENLSFTQIFYQLRLNILLRYTQQFTPRAITFVPSSGHSIVNCASGVHFVIGMLLREVPVLLERYEACSVGHRGFTRTLANLQVSVEDVRNPDRLRMVLINAFSAVHDRSCGVCIEEGLTCPAIRATSLIHAGKYVLNCDSLRWRRSAYKYNQ